MQYFKELVWDIVPALEESGLAEIGAGLSEAAAVCRAKRMLDHRFSSMTREDLDRIYLLGIENDLGEDPYDALVRPRDATRYAIVSKEYCCFWGL